MRIVILSETFSKNMGYAESSLSKALARLGAEVHLVTMDLPPYYNLPEFQQTYASFLGLPKGHPGVEDVDGYKVHYLRHKKRLGYMRMDGLMRKLWSLKPDIVQTFVAISWIPLDAALAKPILKYRLFTGNHTTASVFPLAQQGVPVWNPERLKSIITRAVPGRLVSLFTEKCFGATKDCADIAVRFFGVQKRKICVLPLGVDTDLFFPISDEESKTSRLQLRQKFGFAPSDIVCIYTGRFASDKNPLVFAQAIAHLVEMGAPYRAIFVGDGAQKEAIQACPGCVVHLFIPFAELPPFYRAADIGVWPTQESTSMLDAAACGLPIVVNDTLLAVERIEGNGITYRLNDVNDLVRALESLRDPALRKQLGQSGAKKMACEFSWMSIAKRRMEDYERALGIGKSSL